MPARTVVVVAAAEVVAVAVAVAVAVVVAAADFFGGPSEPERMDRTWNPACSGSLWKWKNLKGKFEF